MNKLLAKFAWLVLFCLVVCSIGRGQPAPSFYPLQIGNNWIYWDYAWGVSGVWDTLTTMIQKDSLMAGRTYFVIDGHSVRYGNRWTSFERTDSTGDVFLFDPGTQQETLHYRLSDTSHSWWNGTLQRFDSCLVEHIFGEDRLVLYVGSYTVDSSAYDTTLSSTRILINRIGFYCSVPSGIIDGGPTILAGGTVSGIPFGIINSVKQQSVDLPVTFGLSQPFPNPFNPSTTLEFTIPIRSRLALEIIDLLGNSVAVLMDTELDPGIYRVPWDASQFASGIYFCRLKADGHISTRRLLLLK